MIRKISVLALLAMISMTQMGCLGKDDEPAAVVCETDLVGTWAVACRVDGSQSRNISMVFTAAGITRTEIQYTAATNCTGASTTTSYVGTYTNVGQGADCAQKVNATFTSPSAMTYFGLFKRVGTTLYDGDEESGAYDGSTEVKRPVKVSATSTYTKQ